MFPTGNLTAGSRTTPPRVVLPFYLYAAVSFLVATMMTYLSSETFTGHYFHPQLLAITHLMALDASLADVRGALIRAARIRTPHCAEIRALLAQVDDLGKRVMVEVSSP